MKKIWDFFDKIVTDEFASIYLVIIDLIAIGVIGAANIDFSETKVIDVFLTYLVITIMFILFHIVFLIPTLMVLAFTSVLGFLASISTPLFLFLYTFESFGSESIEGATSYGFFTPLLITLAITPIGIIIMKVNIKIINW